MSHLPRPSQHDGTALPAGERHLLLEAARRLEQARRRDAEVQPLRGRHLAVSGADHQAPSVRLFERAATALGARVSHIGLEAVPADLARAETAARLLGSLYDAVDCTALPPARARALQRLAGVPIYADLCGAASPLHQLVPALAAEQAAPADALLCLVQAVLIESLG